MAAPNSRIIYDNIRPNMNIMQIVDARSNTLHNALVSWPCSEELPNQTFENFQTKHFAICNYVK